MTYAPLTVAVFLFLAGCGGSTTRPRGARGDAAADALAPDTATPANTTDATPGADTSDAAPVDLAPDVGPPDHYGLVGDVFPAAARLVADMTMVTLNTFGQCPAMGSVRISNAGGQASGALAVTTTGGFTLGVDECQGRKLNPAESCAIEVRLQKNSPGPVDGTLVVQAQPGGQVMATLKGSVGIVEGPAFSPSAPNFGSVTVGSSSAPITITLSNTGGTPATLGPSGVSTDQFVITADTCGNATLPAGQTCGITVVFRPTSAGDKTALLTLKVPGPCGETVGAVPLSGSGIARPDAGADGP